MLASGAVSRSTILWVSFLLPVAGCGEGEPFDYVKVTGKVTYEDGSLIPAHRVEVMFISLSPPVDPRTHPRPGSAEVNVSDGTFKDVSSHEFGDGAVRGKHKVLVKSYDELNVPTSHVPPEYGSVKQTPFEVDTADSPYHFKVRKPS